jgi:hypothetical protein
LIVNYVPKLHVGHVGLVGFVSLGTAAWVQLDRSNQEDSKTGRVGIPGRPVLLLNRGEIYRMALEICRNSHTFMYSLPTISP